MSSGRSPGSGTTSRCIRGVPCTTLCCGGPGRSSHGVWSGWIFRARITAWSGFPGRWDCHGRCPTYSVSRSPSTDPPVIATICCWRPPVCARGPGSRCSRAGTRSRCRTVRCCRIGRRGGCAARRDADGRCGVPAVRCHTGRSVAGVRDTRTERTHRFGTGPPDPLRPGTPPLARTVLATGVGKTQGARVRGRTPHRTSGRELTP